MLMFDGIQIIGHNDNNSTPFVFYGANDNVVFNNILLTKTDENTQAGYLIDIPGSVVNLLVNGVLAQKVGALINGDPTSGHRTVEAVYTEPPLE